eukprot:2777438-Prymnesium_polylepis.1
MLLTGVTGVTSRFPPAAGRNSAAGAAVTWKSQADEVLYGIDLDGSGSLRDMMTALEAQHEGAA